MRGKGKGVRESKEGVKGRGESLRSRSGSGRRGDIDREGGRSRSEKEREGYGGYEDERREEN
jgi:hypothetical protein